MYLKYVGPCAFGKLLFNEAVIFKAFYKHQNYLFKYYYVEATSFCMLIY